MVSLVLAKEKCIDIWKGIISSEDGGVVILLPLGVAVVSTAPFSGASVTPMTGTVGSGGEAEVVAIGYVRGTA